MKLPCSLCKIKDTDDCHRRCKKQSHYVLHGWKLLGGVLIASGIGGIVAFLFHIGIHMFL